MRRMFLALSTTLCVLPVYAAAGELIDGTWKTDVKTMHFEAKPDVMLLKDGIYTCSNCTPAYTVPADGADHPVAGSPYYDSAAVTTPDDHTVHVIHKKAGKVTVDVTMTVAPDGKSLTYNVIDSSASTAGPVTGHGTETRIAAGPDGSAVISGSWQVQPMASISDNATLVSFAVADGALTMHTPTGQSYTAKLDGTEAPYTGDPGTTSVSVRKRAPNVFEETDMRDGKVIGIATMTLAADGKSMEMAWDDKLRASKSTMTAYRQ